jgi:hypothetical protein
VDRRKRKAHLDLASIFGLAARFVVRDEFAVAGALPYAEVLLRPIFRDDVIQRPEDIPQVTQFDGANPNIPNITFPVITPTQTVKPPDSRDPGVHMANIDVEYAPTPTWLVQGSVSATRGFDLAGAFINMNQFPSPRRWRIPISPGLSRRKPNGRFPTSTMPCWTFAPLAIPDTMRPISSWKSGTLTA